MLSAPLNVRVLVVEQRSSIEASEVMRSGRVDLRPQDVCV